MREKTTANEWAKPAPGHSITWAGKRAARSSLRRLAVCVLVAVGAAMLLSASAASALPSTRTVSVTPTLGFVGRVFSSEPIEVSVTIPGFDSTLGTLVAVRSGDFYFWDGSVEAEGGFRITEPGAYRSIMRQEFSLLDRNGRELASFLDDSSGRSFFDIGPEAVPLTRFSGGGGIEFVPLSITDPSLLGTFYETNRYTARLDFALTLTTPVFDAETNQFVVQSFSDLRYASDFSAGGINQRGRIEYEYIPAVPEPSTALLLAAGLGVLAMRRSGPSA